MNEAELGSVKQITFIGLDEVLAASILYEAGQRGKAGEWPYNGLPRVIALLEEETDEALRDLGMNPRPRAVGRLG